jgi:sulfatase maturation enzyme AslB (radical SAM superfamily)
MSCSFCFVDRTVPDFEAEGLKHDIERMRAGGGRHLVLSGGEPTLHPELTGLLAYGRELGFETIEIQTNGVRAADAAYAAQLVASGLSRATVSLHSIRAEESDRVTRLPGGFEKSLRAIDNFRTLGITTQIAHVITKANYRELPATVRWLSRRFPSSGGHLSLCLAIAQGISDLVFTGVVPTFTEIEPYVREALDHCLEHDVGFGGMIGQGGYPPCMLGGQLRYYDNVLDQVFVSEDTSEQFYKAERCRDCSFEPYCVGVRRAYADTYGDEELRPFAADLSRHASLRPLRDNAGLVQLRARRDLT